MDPPWRVKVRPCPFYSQGRCLFADSCNFRHSAIIKAEINPEVALLRSMQAKSPKTPRNARSPRIDSLLLALGDAISPEPEEDSDDDDDDPVRSYPPQSIDTHASQEEDISYTLYDESAASHKISKDLEDLKGDEVTPAERTSPPSIAPQERSTPLQPDAESISPSAQELLSSALTENDSQLAPSPQAIPSQDRDQTASAAEDNTVVVCTPANTHLLSPVTATLPRVPFSRDNGSIRSVSVYSSDKEWTSPKPLQLEPPTSPALSSTFDILSSPFRSPRITLPTQFGSFLSFFRAGSSAEHDGADQDVAELDLDSPPPPASVDEAPIQGYGEESAYDYNFDADFDENASISAVSVDSVDADDDLAVPAALEEDITLHPASESDFAVAISSPATSAPVSEPVSLPLVPPATGPSTSVTERLPSFINHSPDNSHTHAPRSRPPRPSSSAVQAEQDRSDPVFVTEEVTLSDGHARMARAQLVEGAEAEEAGAEVEAEEAKAEEAKEDPNTGQSVSVVQESFIASSELLAVLEATTQASSWDDDGDGDATPIDSESPTAELAYLESPADGPDDTLHSLYEVYSDAASPTSTSHDASDPEQEKQDDLVKDSKTWSSSPSRDIAPAHPSRTHSPSSPSPEASPEPLASTSRSLITSPVLPVDPDQGPRVFSRPPTRNSSTSTKNSTSHTSHKDNLSLSSGSSNDRRENLASSKAPFGFRSKAKQRPITIMSEPLQSPALKEAEGTDSDDAKSESRLSTRTRGLKPLRLSIIVNSRPTTPVFSMPLSSSSYTCQAASQPSHPGSPSSSVSLSSHAPSKSGSSNHASHHSTDISHSRGTSRSSRHLSAYDPHSAPLASNQPWSSTAKRTSSIRSRHSRQIDRYSSRISEPDLSHEELTHADENDLTIVSRLPATAPATRPASVIFHPPTTPRPNLLFAIASDDVDQVREALDNGDVSANDQVGPQCALAFTLSNDQIHNKLDIVKTLLAYGADPAALDNPELNPPPRRTSAGEEGDGSRPLSTKLENMDPALRYYISRAQSENTKKSRALLNKSLFQPLSRVCFELVGQDRALEQLFRALSINSKQRKPPPIVTVFCGPSGHGKSFVAHRFSSLLNVPSHTVNMTTVRNPDGLWKSLSMGPEDDISQLTLAEFLVENEGRQCVVVLDEIEKTAKENLFSLLVPFELGRCPLESGRRHVDVRKVIWVATSNIGQETVVEYDSSRPTIKEPMSRQEYLELTTILRDQVSARLGASLLSRVTCVLPFVPFTEEERRAIAAESLMTMGGEEASDLPLSQVDEMVDRALLSYVPSEGARSLYRAVSSQLADV